MIFPNYILMVSVVAVVVIGLAIAAAILRAAVALANKILRAGGATGPDGARDWDIDLVPVSGAPGRDYSKVDREWAAERPAPAPVPVPSAGHAMAIVFVTGIIQFVAGFAVGFVMFLAAQPKTPKDQQALQLVGSLVSFPVGLLVSWVLLAVMLPTSLGRAALVLVMQFLISLLIGVVLGAVALVLILTLHNR